jgi:hypothetical protein
MNRWIAIASLAMLACGTSAYALPQQRGRGDGSQMSQEMKDAREALQRDIAEGKRLQEQLKIDRSTGNKTGVESDLAALKVNREQVKRDQERIKQLTNGRGRSGEGRSGGGRSGAGRAGGRGRGGV